jgi:uncharacterized protein YyaL (SSP411 family)
VFRLLGAAAGPHAQAFGHLLQAMHLYFSPKREVALVGDELDALARVVRPRFHPTIVLAGMRPGDATAAGAIPLLRDRTPVDGKPAAYVCQNFACNLPVTEPGELERQL